MILAAGLSPAWQQVLVFDSFQVGEVNRARAVHWFASGKVLNVANALHDLGAPCRILALVGGPRAQDIADEFRERGVAARWVHTQAPTRVCTTIVSRGPTTELVENARPVESEALEEFRQAYEEEARAAEVVVLIGSLPPGTPATFYRSLLEKTSARVVLDARGEELLRALDCEPFVVKPNREELASTLGLSIDSDPELVAAMRELNHRGARWVVVTHGKESIWMTSERTVIRARALDVESVNTIGCGDSLAAGMAWALERQWEPAEALRYAIACAAENARGFLIGRLRRESVEELASSVEVREVRM